MRTGKRKGHMYTTTDPGYLTLEQAAVFLNAKVGTLRVWVRRRGVPHYKPGRNLLFRQAELESWMRRYRQGLQGLELTGFRERVRR